MKTKIIIFSTLLALSMLMTAGITALAEGDIETKCSIKPYMNKPAQVFVDEDFESYEDGQKILSTQTDQEAGAVYSGGSSNYPVAVKDGDNTYATTSTRQWTHFDIVGRPYSEAKYLTLSFDFAIPSASGQGFSVYLGSTWFFNFMKSGNNLWIRWSPGGGNSGGAETLVTIDNSKGGFVNFTATLIKKEDGVYAESIVFNDELIDMSSLKDKVLSMNWQDSNIRIGNNAVEMQIDNILIYEPMEFKITNSYLDSTEGVINTDCTGAVDLNKSSAELIYENGTEKCSISYNGEDNSKLIITPATAIDTDKYTYKLKINLCSLANVMSDEYTQILEKEYFEVNEESVKAEINDNLITGNIELEPKSDEVIYVVMSAWNGEKCMGLTINEVNLSSETSVSPELTVENGEDVDKIQMFFIDSTKNMRLIHSVYNIDM